MEREYVPYRLLFYFVPKKNQKLGPFSVYHAKMTFCRRPKRSNPQERSSVTRRPKKINIQQIFAQEDFFLTPA
jgi:hypothetical protein